MSRGLLSGTLVALALLPACGEGVGGRFVPPDPGEAAGDLAWRLPPLFRVEMAGTCEDVVAGRYHFGLGSWMRAAWGLWGDPDGGSRSPLRRWFLDRGVRHPDDMSGVVLILLWRRLNRRPADIEGLLADVRARQELPAVEAVLTDSEDPVPGFSRTARDDGPSVRGLSVDATGRYMLCAYMSISRLALEQEWTEVCDFRETTPPGEACRVPFLLRGDRNAPWEAVRGVLRILSSPRSRCDFVWLAGQRPDGTEGGFAVTPEQDRGGFTIEVPAQAPFWQVFARLEVLRRAGERGVVIADPDGGNETLRLGFRPPR